MDIIRITMNGYGCELNRGIVPDGNEKEIEKSLNNIWFKNIFNKLEQKTKWFLCPQKSHRRSRGTFCHELRSSFCGARPEPKTRGRSRH